MPGAAIPVLSLLAPIVVILIGLMHDFVREAGMSDKEELPMKAKTKKYYTMITSVLNSVWSMGANFSAGALLT